MVRRGSRSSESLAGVEDPGVESDEREGSQDIRWTRLDELSPHPRNPRKGNVEAIAKLIQEHGFHGTLVAQLSTGRILAGEHRWRALQLLGYEGVNVDWRDVDDEQALAIVLTDNRASDLADYDMPTLAEVLGEMPDPSAVLYDQPDVDAILKSVAPPQETQNAREVNSLREMAQNYPDAVVRQFVLGFGRPHYQWVVARFASLKEKYKLDSNQAILIRLLEEATGEKLPQ
jgi:hypothetical protein